MDNSRITWYLQVTRTKFEKRKYKVTNKTTFPPHTDNKHK